ncbi:alpha/beta hydrolase family protein [Kitasatospora sp. McL0602]|uniref:alpha/beta hydrolase family protein n=1 Tax=Kitasatospora sp. McL0602 TaxID=3439530 RepID=UPI003F8A1CB6
MTRAGAAPTRAAVHGLLTCGRAGYWWEDSEAGARLTRGDAEGVHPVQLGDGGDGSDGLVPLAVHPADGAPPAVLRGWPGGDYGYLSEPQAPDQVLARRPALVRLAEVASAVGRDAGPGFVYTGFPPGARLSAPPVEGVRVAVHRLGDPFRADRPVPLDVGPGALLSLEATADPSAALLKSASPEGTSYQLLRFGGETPDGVTVTRLAVAATARTRLVLGADRWWHGEALGTPRAELRALRAGSTDPAGAERVVFPDGTALAWFWGTRRGVLVRALTGRGAGAGEALYWVDGDTLRPRLVAGGEPGGSFPEIAASPSDDCAVWLRVSARPGGASVRRMELLLGGEDEPRRLREELWPMPARRVTEYCTAGDGLRLPVQLSGDAGPVLLLEHGGLTALANAPLERALEEMTGAGEVSLARVVTRSLVPAHRVPQGERGYNDLLHAARWLRERVGPTRPLVVLGHSMGAVGAARAVLLEPGLFDGWVLRFPVTDLVGFPALGIGRHWTAILGDPARPDHRAALAALSPLHLPLPAHPLPPLLIQTGTYDTRADSRHGELLAQRLGGAGPVTLSNYPIGHVERFCEAASRRAVAEVTAFVRGCPPLARDLEGASL